MKRKLTALLLIFALFLPGCGKIGDGSSDRLNEFNKLNSGRKNKQVINIKMTADSPYDDGIRKFTVLGLKEYHEIKGEKLTDTPDKGKVFLTVFMQVNLKDNKDGENFYFNYQYLSAKADGKKVKHTFLLNDPFGYGTLLKNYPQGQDAGYLVYEVPEEWQELVINYTGLKEIAGNNLFLTLTKKDLKDPEEKWKVIPE